MLVVLSMAFGRPNGDLFAGLWAAVILCSAFLISPVAGYANMPVVMILLFTPLIGMTAGRYALPFCSIALGLLACVLIWQYFFAPELMYHGKRAAWPLLDPNNAGALMAVGALIAHPAFCALYLIAILCTGSKSAAIATGVIIGWRWNKLLPQKYKILVMLAFFALSGLWFVEPVRAAIEQRLEIWRAVLPVIDWHGYGIGTFYKFYPAIRQEHTSDGFFVHNDYLHVAFEMGWLLLPFFLAFVLDAFRRVTARNAAAVGGFAAICLIALVNYPFFVPPVAIMAGVLYADKNRCYDNIGQEGFTWQISRGHA